MPACQGGIRTNVLACQRGLRANVPARQCAKNVPTSHFYVPTWQLTCQRAKRRANFSTWRANVPRSVPIFQTCFLQNTKRNFYSLLLYKKFYIILISYSYISCVYVSYIKTVLYL